jgi:hypothetical protein
MSKENMVDLFENDEVKPVEEKVVKSSKKIMVKRAAAGKVEDKPAEKDVVPDQMGQFFNDFAQKMEKNNEWQKVSEAKKDLGTHISNLINIYNFVDRAVNGLNLSKEYTKPIQNMQLVLQNKIVQSIVSDEFKASIGYEKDAQDIITNAIAMSNIKRGMNKV